MPRDPSERSALAQVGGAVLRFAGGYAVGLIVVPVVMLGVWTVQARLRAPGPPGPFVSVGADLSRAGVRSVVWQQPRESLRQTCRDGCDDIWFNYPPMPKAVEVSGPSDPAWRPRVRSAEKAGS